MHKAAMCFTTSTTSGTGSRNTPKFPARPVKKTISAKATAEDTLKRYPRIMAELAK